MNLITKSNVICMSVIAPLWGACSPVLGQVVWSSPSNGFSAYTEAFADDPFDGAPPCFTFDTSVATVPGLFGKDFAGRSYSDCGILIFTCPLRGSGWVHFWVEGLGTPTVHVQWYAISRAYHHCYDRPAYTAWGVANLVADVVLEPTGVPDGTPVTVDYLWSQFSLNNLKHEAGGEDPAHVKNTELLLNGTALHSGLFDLDNVRGIKWLPNQVGSFATVAGAAVTVEVAADTRAEINSPGRGPANEDLAVASFWGEMYLSVAGPVVIPGGISAMTPYRNLLLEFSLDIGSDTELSDPFMDGDEVFDPGDLYVWHGPLLAGPTNGGRDDATIFGIDPSPSPIPLTSAPTCSGLSPADVVGQHFDLDGTDSLDFSVTQVLPPINQGPPVSPIGAFASHCVQPGDHLIVSYDDDEATPYVGGPFSCGVPVDTESPFLLDTFGSTPEQDEIVGLNLITLVSPAVVLGEYAIEAEDRLHVNLAPNPDGPQADDDDVDALDIYDDPAICNVWVFSPDHEATFFDPNSNLLLRPGSIYEVAAGGPVEVVRGDVHLGISREADIDAFEFVWTFDAAFGGQVLTLLFSVDDDDPLTVGVDESGGLDPRMIYASYLTGSSWDYLDQPLKEDIDAITNWWTPLTPAIPPQPQCICGDVDGSGGPVNLADFAAFAACFGLSAATPGCLCADLDADGSITLGDFATFSTTFGAVSPNSPPNCP